MDKLILVKMNDGSINWSEDSYQQLPQVEMLSKRSQNISDISVENNDIDHNYSETRSYWRCCQCISLPPNFLFISIVVLCFVSFIFLLQEFLFSSIEAFRSSQFLYNTIIKYQGKIYLQDTDSTLFLRSDMNSQFLFTDSFPRLHGSSFSLHQSSHNKHCFKLQTSAGFWLKLNSNWRVVSSSSEANAMELSFSTNSLHESIVETKMILESLVVVCNQPLMYLVANNRSFDKELVLEVQRGSLNASVFRISKQVQVKGVNLGGWFIPEVWMSPGFYNGTGLGWGGSLCSMVRFNRSLAEERMLQNLNSWIVEEDFASIASLGYNSVRLPIGYWNVIEDPYLRYAPSQVETSLQFIDHAFEWAEKYKLTILVDFHGAPGSQNGIDHSGCGMDPRFLEIDLNVNLLLKAIEAVIVKYGNHNAFLGIEMLNEPVYRYSEKNHSSLYNFYQRGYNLIRSYHSSCWIVFNELYAEFYDLWEFPESDESNSMPFVNVIMDLHLYDWQEPFTKESANQHIQDAKNWTSVVERLSLRLPILIGEVSCLHYY